MTALSVVREDLMVCELYDMEERVSVDHLLAPIQSTFDKEGRILVSRDGLRMFLHRRLYAIMIGPPPALLYRFCDTWGCQNPFHFSAKRPSLGKCRNRHHYVQGDRQSNGSMRCGKCRRARNERRRRGGEPHWMAEQKRMYCPYGHEYTDENTYKYPTTAGVRRKCKACAAIRSAGGDPADSAQEIAPF